MNLYMKELKNYRKGLIFWALGILLFILASMAKYQTLQDTGQSASELIAQFPQAIRVVFGLEGFDLTTASGYYGVLYLYVALMLSVHAILIGTDIISKEERDKTAEFLLAKPLSRAKVMTSKLLAGLTHVLLLGMLTNGMSILFVEAYNKGSSVTNEILLLSVGLLFLQLIFFFLGTAIAAGSKKPKRAGSAATAVLLGAFIIAFLINLDGRLDIFKYLSPFKYFEARALLDDGLSVMFVMLSMVIISLALLLTYRLYRRRDITV